MKSWWGESSPEELLRVLIVAVVALLILLFLWTAVINKWWALNTFTLLETYFCYLAKSKGIAVLPNDTVNKVCEKLSGAYPVIAGHANTYRQWHEQSLYQEEIKISYYSATFNLFKLTAALVFSRKK